MIWTAARGTEVCGACRVLIERDAPVALLTAKELPRCPSCVAPAEVDWAAVDAAVVAHAAERAAHPINAVATPGAVHAPLLVGFVPLANTAALNDMLKAAGITGVTRSQPVNPRSPKPFSAVADDPTIARLCDEGNR